MALGVIPARLESTRFPGKVLHLVAGKPMVQWVWERARRASSLEEVVIATDSDAIERAARSFGARVVRTRSDHPSGSSRVAEAAGSFPHDVVVNIQADEPLVDPLLLDRLIAALGATAWADVATPVVALTEQRRFLDPNVVKVVLARDGRVLFFSRAPLPHGFTPRAAAGTTWEHVGIYAFKRHVLDSWASLPPSALEEAERLEQLRLMDAGYAFVAVQAEHPSPGVNTPEDVPMVESLLRRMQA